eukprot:gene1435-831_t
MGYVDRGGGREAKGASLRRSKKNPGCGASRQLNKGNASNAGGADPSQRAAAVPPPMFILPRQEGAGAGVEPFSQLIAPTPTHVICAAGALAETLAAAAAGSIEAAAPAGGTATAAFHLDGSVALLSRRLAEEDVTQVLSRALAEGNVSGLLCWSSEVERQQALAAQCEDALQSTTFMAARSVTISEPGAGSAQQNDGGKNVVVPEDVQEKDEAAAASEVLIGGILNKLPTQSPHSMNTQRVAHKKIHTELQDEKRVRFDVEGSRTTLFAKDDPPSSSPTGNRPPEAPPHRNSLKAQHAAAQPDVVPPGPPADAPHPRHKDPCGRADVHFASLSSSLPYAVVGIHPNNIDRMNQPLQEQWLTATAALAMKHVPHAPAPVLQPAQQCAKGVVGGPAVVGVLSGLDLSRKSGTHHAQEWTLRQLYKMAAALELPLVLHLRVDAAAGGNQPSALHPSGGVAEGEETDAIASDARARQAMADTGDRLAELLQEWAHHRQRSATTRKDLDGMDADADVEEVQSDKEDDGDEEDAGTASTSVLFAKQKVRPRHPPAVVLHNAWGTLALSPALQQLFCTSRPEATGCGKSDSCGAKPVAVPPALYLSVSAEDMLHRCFHGRLAVALHKPAADGAHEGPVSDRGRLLSVLPSLAGPPRGNDTVAFSQLLITTGSPWHTPGNLEDEYLRTRPNEPANYRFVLQAVAQALLEKLLRSEANESASARQLLERIRTAQQREVEIARISEVLGAVSTLNTLAVFFGRYWAARHQQLYQAAREAGEPHVAPAALAEDSSPPPAATTTPGDFFNASPEAAVPYVCANCRTKLFTAGQAMWHELPAPSAEHATHRMPIHSSNGRGVKGVLQCSGGGLQLPLPLPAAALAAEQQRHTLIECKPGGSSGAGMHFRGNPPSQDADDSDEETQRKGRKQKAQKQRRKKQHRRQQDSSSSEDDSDDGHVVDDHQLSGNEANWRLDVRSPTLQPALRSALLNRFGKSFWVSPAASASSTIAVSCHQCKAKLGAIHPLPMQVLPRWMGGKEGTESALAGRDNDEDGSSEDTDEDVDKYLTGSAQAAKKRRHDKLAKRKLMKQSLHEKHQKQQHQHRGAPQVGVDGTERTTLVSTAVPPCQSCGEPLLYAAAGNVLPLHIRLDPHAVAPLEGDNKLLEEEAGDVPTQEAAHEECSTTATRVEAALGTAAAPHRDDEDELSKLLRQAALEREEIEREREREEAQRAQDLLEQKKLIKRVPKKNVKANNRSNFTHFRNKDFGKSVPVTAGDQRKPVRQDGGDGGSSDEDQNPTLYFLNSKTNPVLNETTSTTLIPTHTNNFLMQLDCVCRRFIVLFVVATSRSRHYSQHQSAALEGKKKQKNNNNNNERPLHKRINIRDLKNNNRNSKREGMRMGDLADSVLLFPVTGLIHLLLRICSELLSVALAHRLERTEKKKKKEEFLIIGL